MSTSGPNRTLYSDLQRNAGLNSVEAGEVICPLPRGNAGCEIERDVYIGMEPGQCTGAACERTCPDSAFETECTVATRGVAGRRCQEDVGRHDLVKYSHRILGLRVNRDRSCWRRHNGADRSSGKRRIAGLRYQQVHRAGCRGAPIVGRSKL
jgi:hypothetical protein